MRRLRAALRLVPADDEPARARVLVTLAWAEAERGRVDLGLRLLDEAEPLTPPGGRPLVHAQRAALFSRNGRADRATGEFDRAVAGLTDPLDLAKVLNNRSMLHLEAGRAGPARDDMTRALRLCRRHEFALGSALLEVNLACLDVVRGDLPAALGAFTTSRTTYASVVPGRLPTLAVEQARALVAAGLFQAADRELAFAVDRAREQGQDNTVAEALHVRAEAALLSGRLEAAAGWADEARAAFLRRRNPRRAALAALLSLRAAPLSATVAARARRSAAELRRLGLHEDSAVAALTAARAMIVGGSPGAPAGAPVAGRDAERLLLRYGGGGRHERLDTRLLRWLTRAEIARAAGRAAEAERHLVAGMNALHRHRARFGCLDLQTGASAHGHDLAAAGLAAALESGSPAAVHRWSERARAQALLLPPVRPPDDPAVAADLEDLRQTRFALREAEVAGRPPIALRGRAEALERRIRENAWSVRGAGRLAAHETAAAAVCGERGPRAGEAAVNRGAAGRGGSAIASLGAVRAGLGGAALVAYVRNRSWLEALVITGKRSAVVRLGEWAVVEEAVLRLRADLDTAAGRALPKRLEIAIAEATRTDAEALQRAVLDPIAALIGDRDLVVVPTGLLMTAPWALLPCCAGRPVTVAPSATAWLSRSRSLDRGRSVAPLTSAADGRVVLVAGPGNQRGAEEITGIAALHPGATVLTGERAAPAETLAALDGAGIAHVAAHGRHVAENALFSELELAGGSVLGYDLQRLARPPRLVVLSSCELGLSEVRPGDETFGMASALLASGTATVVASVARVADEAAQETMVRFHRALASGHNPASALAGAAAGTGFVCLGGSGP
ncbi:CHAT domain-containing protein [Actinoplanes bogorensis]|uniref:CHAT domain-containing protein n=1 Tax=Paractinoplanes bogorensis TaxID=1610840 RepID=A0ABS5Z0E6_9ACTN|nr:CHAT domain-containing protein [Actinoplanes bogorensis]MBU2669163.1 CHAT domain-containing protein [Actinoplanes bogorensis]